MDYCMCTYGVKNSDRQTYNSSIRTEYQFAKFNSRQIILLYSKMLPLGEGCHQYNTIYHNVLGKCPI